MNTIFNKLNDTIHRRVKPKASICSLYKYKDTAFWLCRVEYIVFLYMPPHTLISRRLVPKGDGESRQVTLIVMNPNFYRHSSGMWVFDLLNRWLLYIDFTPDKAVVLFCSAKPKGSICLLVK